MVLFPLTYPILWTGLAGYTIKIKKLTQSHKTFSNISDDWGIDTYIRKHHIVGDIQYFTLNCFEEGTSWNDSVAKKIQTAATTGEAVRFYLITPPRDIDIQVFILDLTVEYRKGEPTYRRFKIFLKEDMN